MFFFFLYSWRAIQNTKTQQQKKWPKKKKNACFSKSYMRVLCSKQKLSNHPIIQPSNYPMYPTIQLSNFLIIQRSEYPIKYGLSFFFFLVFVCLLFFFFSYPQPEFIIPGEKKKKK